jgi:hypothetical protein
MIRYRLERRTGEQTGYKALWEKAKLESLGHGSLEPARSLTGHRKGVHGSGMYSKRTMVRQIR